jgi:hypothetical protein
MTNRLVLPLIIFSCVSAQGMEKEKEEFEINVDVIGRIPDINYTHTILDVKNLVRTMRAFPVESQILSAYKDGNTSIDSSSAPLSDTILVHKAVKDYNTRDFWVSIKPTLMSKHLYVGQRDVPMKTVIFTVGANLPLENSGLATGVYTPTPTGAALYLATIADDWYFDFYKILNKKRSCKKNQHHELIQYADTLASKVATGLYGLRSIPLEQLKALPEDEYKEKTKDQDDK